MFKTKDKIRIDNLETEVNELRNEIDFIHELLQPSPRESIDEENGDPYYDGPNTEIPAEIYREIRKYCENKDFIFMGIA